jgi:hypothetical protein
MALQDPATAFTDPVLQGGIVESDDVLNLPRPRSGQMASVYKLFEGRKKWAIRCFNFDSMDRAARYAAISDFLARNPNRYTVDFAYAESGIIVGGLPYPTVKMEWVDGDLLHTYIAKHLTAPAALERLARAWIEMVRYLHALRFAHGDLQHGNVLVTSAGDLKLVDYDGMFVPQFAGHPSSEDGHPNYQHPCRQSSDFGPQLDNFSAWSIYLSIVALARDPNAWETLRCGDDCLAFRRADYVCPSTSAAFISLKSAPDPDVRKIARFLESMLSHEPSRLPALENNTQVAAGLGAQPRPDVSVWRLPPFKAEPLGAGIYTEPYEPRPAGQPSNVARPLPQPPAVPPVIARAGAGIVASIAGYWAFAQLGFATNEYLAVVSLGWALAAVLAVASRSTKPPGGSGP